MDNLRLGFELIYQLPLFTRTLKIIFFISVLKTLS